MQPTTTPQLSAGGTAESNEQVSATTEAQWEVVEHCATHAPSTPVYVGSELQGTRSRSPSAGRISQRPQSTLGHGGGGVGSAEVPGWASAGQARSWTAAGVWARRLHDSGLTQAQLFLVLDGLLPWGWEREDYVASHSDAEAALRLQEVCRIGSLGANILGLGANVPRSTPESTDPPRAAAAGPSHF